MKLRYIANARIPTEKAHGIQIVKMCEAFAGNGINVSLWYPSRNNPKFKNTDPFVFYRSANNFNLKKIFSPDPYFLIKLWQGTYIKAQLIIFFTMLAVRMMLHWPARNEVVYTRDEYLLSLLNLFSKNVFWEAHNLPRNLTWYLKHIKKCRGVVVITKGLADELIANGVEREKILVAPDGFDPKLYQDSTEVKLPLPEKKPVVMYTGHLYSWKGADLLASAASDLDATVVFVGGSGNELKEMEKTYHDMPNIVFVPHQPYYKIPAYLRQADILVIPNSAKSEISSRFTSPLKLFEYLAAGKPIVAADLPSLREIVSEREVEFFEADNIKSLVSAIQKVLQDQVYAAELASHAKVLSNKYSWLKRAIIIEEFIKTKL